MEQSPPTFWIAVGKTIWKKVLLGLGWEKVPNWECSFVHRKQGLFLSVYVDDIKLAERKQNMAPMWKKLWRMVDLGLHFSTTCIRVALNVNANRTRILLSNTKMFESRISEGATPKLPGWEKPHAKTVVWSCDIESEELESVGEMSKVCSQIVLKCLYLTRIGGPDILWSVNKLARAVTEWTRACERRLARLISYIHHTNHHRRCTIVPRLWVCWRLWRFWINFGRNFVYLRKSNICSWKLDVQETNFSITQFYRRWIHWSRCSFTHGRYFIPNRTEQMDPSESYGENRRQLSGPTCITPFQSSTPTPFQQNIDHIPSNTTHSGPSAMLYVFEDNEAGIKMIPKGRSPILRHASRTHRVALDWLFDKINLDQKNSNPLHWHQTSTRSHFDQRKNSHVMSGTIFFICSIPAVSVLSAVPNVSA